jgi:hypothetical protein
MGGLVTLPEEPDVLRSAATIDLLSAMSFS